VPTLLTPVEEESSLV
jgi:hypothetical protein